MVYIKERETQLKKQVSIFDLLMFGIGSTIGTGIFILFGLGVEIAGFGLIVSFLVGAIISSFIALNYAELGSSIPLSAGSYAYVKEGLGGIVAFYVGWFVWFGCVVFAALSTIGFIESLNYLLPVSFPDLFGILIVFFFVIYNLRGTKEAMRIQKIITLVLLSILMMYIVFGFTRIDVNNITSMFSKGLSPIFMATALIFVCYIGFEPITAVSEEVKNPKYISLALVVSVLVASVIYVLISYVTLGSLSVDVIINSKIPLFELARENSMLLGFVFFAAILATLSSLNTTLLAASRNLFALSRDGYLPRIFADINEKYGTPHTAILLSAFMVVLFIATGMVQFIASVSSFGFIITFSLVSLSLLILREKRKFLFRPFKLPIPMIFAFLGTILPLILIPFLESSAIFIGLVWMIVGFFVYCLHTLGVERFRIAFAGINVLISGLSLSLWYSFRIGFQTVKPLTKLVVSYVSLIVAFVCIIVAILFLLRIRIPGRSRKFQRE
jgi:amino acid transporter